MVLLFSLLLIVASIIVSILYFFHKKKKKNKSPFYYFGVGYLFMGLPIILSFVVFAGLYLVLSGVFLIILGRWIDSDRFKYFATIPLIALFAFLIYWEAPYADVLIPNGYKGRVVIVHDCKNGSEKERKNIYRRIYQVNNEGILHTKFSFLGNLDMNRLDFYYVDKSGNRKLIQKYFDGFYKEQIGIQWDDARIYYGFLNYPHPNENHKIMNFILERKVYEPHEYKKEEIPSWYDKVKCI